MTRTQKKIVLMMLDAIIISTSFICAYFLILDSFLPNNINYLTKLIIEVGIFLILGTVTRVYSRINRFINARELLNLVLTLFTSFILTLLVVLFSDFDLNLRLFTLTFIFAATLIVLSRMAWKYFVILQLRKSHMNDTRPINTLLIGAGTGADILIERLNKDEPNLKIMGILDDDNEKRRTSLHGIPVIGKIANLKEVIKRYHIEQVTVAIPSLDSAGYQEIVDQLKSTKVKLNRMPKLPDILSDNSNVTTLEELDVTDLLERPEVKLDMTQIYDSMQGKTALITGAGGSIGSEIVRQISKFSPNKVILVGHGENSIYLITREMRKKYPENIQFVPVIGDIQDRNLMFQIMEKYQPEVVYHAAAHKHVPLMEYNPHEAIKNNVFGTYNVAEAAKRANVNKFVMISTDKAVNSTSVMGATKRMAEMIVTNENEPGKTKFAVVRFGNVLGSRGSVVPLFKRQIASGGPITITDKRMTRYFMTIPEASRLVIQAGALATGGELFILDMDKPVKILDLAKNMLKLTGHTEEEIGIEEIGMRPGEKLYEELLTTAESTDRKVFDKIYLGHVSQYRISDVLDYANYLLGLDDAKLTKSIIQYANAYNGEEKVHENV